MTLIAIHLLQNHAPSNLNRDDNGDPKDAIFGGVRRARISSQALKRSMRMDAGFQKSLFSEEETRSKIDRPALLGFRTQWLPEQIRSIIQGRADLSEAERATIVKQAAKLGTDKETSAASSDEKLATQQLMYLTDREVSGLAESLIKLLGKTFKRDKKEIPFGEWKGSEVAQVIGVPFEPHAVDIAMFGRMTTSSPFKDIDAAVQVAHALSTHKVEQEFDYFTAMEDRPVPGALGASFIGDVAFNSATYYKYINLHWEELVNNLGGQRDVAASAVTSLLRAAMTAIPSGKQNTFAAHNLPDFALVEVLEKNTPVSYANAFLKPVRPRDDLSLMDASIAAFAAYAAPLPTRFGLPVQRAVFHTQTAPALGDECATVEQLAAWVAGKLPEARA